ncbi:MAG: hypothetical protein ACXVCE_06960 [Bacteriovorax sp.]
MIMLILDNKLKAMRTFLICLFLFSHESFAKNFECPTIDLTKRSPLSERKHFYQGDTGWCCSFAFVDALDLKYGKNFSPVDIAITEAHSQKRLNGCQTLDEIPKALNVSHGLCAENQFRQMKNPGDKFKNLKRGDDLSEYLTFLATESHAAELKDLEELWERTRTEPKYRASVCEFEGMRNSPIFSNIKNYRDIGAVIKKDLDKDYFDFLYSLAEKNCLNREKVQVEYESIDVDEDGISDLFQFLNKGTSPIIHIYSQSLFNDPAPDASMYTQLGEWMNGDHAVNLVGVRPIGERCYIKVRDSSYGGKNCNGINKTWVICSPGSKDEGTYEVEVGAFIKAARDGLIIK